MKLLDVLLNLINTSTYIVALVCFLIGGFIVAIGSSPNPGIGDFLFFAFYLFMLGFTTFGYLVRRHVSQ